MKETTIDELQARLEAYLEQLRKGEPIRVIKGSREFEEIAAAFDGPVITKHATRDWRTVELPESNDHEHDIVKYLLEDRGR
jgi:hypothetical protein